MRLFVRADRFEWQREWRHGAMSSMSALVSVSALVSLHPCLYFLLVFVSVLIGSFCVRVYTFFFLTSLTHVCNVFMSALETNNHATNQIINHTTKPPAKQTITQKTKQPITQLSKQTTSRMHNQQNEQTNNCIIKQISNHTAN